MIRNQLNTTTATARFGALMFGYIVTQPATPPSRLPRGAESLRTTLSSTLIQRDHALQDGADGQIWVTNPLAYHETARCAYIVTQSATTEKNRSKTKL